MFAEKRYGDQFEVRTTVDPLAITRTVRQSIREVVKMVPVTRVKTLEEQVDATIVPERLIATLSELFGALGAALAGIGLYGLLAYTVARRTNEIGVRMALGATPGNVSSLVLRDVIRMLGSGLVFGILLVEWGRPLASRLVEDLKFESAVPLALGGSAIVLVGLVAAYVPVRRAVRVDPLVALRHE